MSVSFFFSFFLFFLLRQGKQSIEVLMMESLRSSIQFRQIVGDTFVKLFDGELTETKKWTAADLLVALVLLSVSARKKTMETIIFKALRKGTLSKSVVKTCLKRFPQVSQLLG